MTRTCLRRWCVQDKGPGMDPPKTFEGYVRALPLHPLRMNTKKRLLQVNPMIRHPKPVFIGLMLAVTSALFLSARAEAIGRSGSPAAREQTPSTQGKTVVLDVPSIAERVNEVVVNVRSISEGGESLGSGFIIDQRGFIATNFHLISNAEPRRGSSQRGPESKGPPKLVNSVTVTLHDGRQVPASIKGYDEATDI